MKISSDDIIKALKLNYCSFLDGGLNIEPVGNSFVHYSQWIPLEKAVAETLVGISLKDIKIGLNYVIINGPVPDGEGLHTHISQIVAIVTYGGGLCLYERDGTLLRANVKKGDIAIIPRNAPHCFEGCPTLHYAVVEFGPEIDYQKHHYK